MKLSSIKVDYIITKSNCEGMDFDIDPYIGCTHGCIYCYAKYMKDFTGHKENWGQFIDIKSNALDLIPEESSEFKGKNILISPVTDPYLPLEKELELTRTILKRLIPLQPNLWILTKSDLVLRDIDLFQEFENCNVGISFSTHDEQLRRKIEPFASAIPVRYETLKRLKEAKVGTFTFIGPIMPFITDWKRIISDTKKFSDSFMFENLKIHGDIWRILGKWLKARDERLLNDYEKIYFTDNTFWNKVENEIRLFCDSFNLDYKIFFHYQKHISS